MSIQKKFLKKFALISSLFLIIGCVLTSYFLKYSVANRASTRFMSELKSSSVIVSQFYSSGDLVNLRLSLNQIAENQGWYSAEFKDIEGTTIWSWMQKPALKDTKELQKAVITKEQEVSSLTFGKMGTLSARKDLSDDVNSWSYEISLVLAAFVVFWAIFLAVIWLSTKKTLISVSNLKEDLTKFASVHGIVLSHPDSNLDELSLVGLWFRELASAWIEAKEHAINNERLAALAKLTQMLAHDVRKPFSMLKVGIDQMINAGNNPSKSREIALKIKDHVGRAYENVNGMITDVMEVSHGSSNLQLESQSIKTIILSALDQVFQYDKDSHISFSYDLHHSSLIEVDQLKIQRVFTNILDNAKQSMNGYGDIWLKSYEMPDLNMIEITIGNSNSLISQEDLDRIFEIFFTKAKKGGTGLGLAICQQIIASHGGSIRCASSAESGTEFIFTLPSTPETTDQENVQLPLNSIEILRSFETSIHGKNDVIKEDPILAMRRHIITSKIKHLNRSLNILIIEDDILYSEGIKLHLETEGSLDRQAHIEIATTSTQALALCKMRAFDLIISDVDLGRNDISGFDLVRDIRTVLPSAKICIHSNRSLADDYKRSMEVGADAFIPKPMSTPHLLGLLVDAVSQVADLTSKEEENTPKVVLVEDDIFIAEAWEITLEKDVIFTWFSKPSELMARAEQDHDFISSLSLIIIDHNFDNEPETKGLDLARRIGTMKDPPPVILSSDQPFSASDLLGIAAIFSKDVMPWDELCQKAGLTKFLSSTKTIDS